MTLKPLTKFELSQVIETELWTLDNTIKADHPRVTRRGKRSSKVELEAGGA